jgi:hypothetical protein
MRLLRHGTPDEGQRPVKQARLAVVSDDDAAAEERCSRAERIRNGAQTDSNHLKVVVEVECAYESSGTPGYCPRNAED